MNDLQLFLGIAEEYARQSTCIRRKYGAVIVDPITRHQISGGFNGNPKGMQHCNELNNCIRQQLNIPQGKQYEACFSIHGEMNALLQAGSRARNCILYLYGYDIELQREIIPKPCFLCTKLMINAGISKVITSSVVWDPNELYLSYISELNRNL
jgi:dCMP deaminase